MLSDRAREPAAELVGRSPELGGCADALVRAAGALAGAFRAGNRLYLCGNGGSHADALHIAGELVKAYVAERPLGKDRLDALAEQPDGELLARGLHAGLPATTLGANGAVTTAIVNDLTSAELAFAQELEAFGCPGDVLVCLSTSGRSRNVVLAAEVARSLNMTVIAFTGVDGRDLAALADVTVAPPASRTNEVQEWHSRLYHALCEMVELELFSDGG